MSSAAGAELLADAVGHYVFVSSISVYASFAEVVDEGSPLAQLSEPGSEDIGQDYGALKALCEEAVESAFPGRSTAVRAGLIVGPHDPTGRFTYWPHRIARGGDVLVPGPAWRPVQLVDVRDLAAWIVRSAEERHAGPFNATGPTTMGAVVDAAKRVTGSTSRAVEVDDAFLAGEEVGEWMELPLWVDTRKDEWRRFLEVDTSRAVAAGLTFRPLDETVAATLEAAELVDGVGLTPEREAELLAAWWGRATLGRGREPGGRDRVERQPLVDLAREAAHADGADPHAVREQRDAPEEEREERVEARELRRPLDDLLGEQCASSSRRSAPPCTPCAAR